MTTTAAGRSSPACTQHVDERAIFSSGVGQRVQLLKGEEPLLAQPVDRWKFDSVNGIHRSPVVGHRHREHLA